MRDEPMPTLSYQCAASMKMKLAVAAGRSQVLRREHRRTEQSIEAGARKLTKVAGGRPNVRQDE